MISRWHERELVADADRRIHTAVVGATVNFFVRVDDRPTETAEADKLLVRAQIDTILARAMNSIPHVTLSELATAKRWTRRR